MQDKGNFSGIQCSLLSDFELQRRPIFHIFKMNKLFIVLLAVCLISVHGFVKRDAPAADNKNYIETIQKQMEEFAKTVNNQMSQAFDPDTIKKNFNEFVDNASKTINQMKAASQPKAA